MGKKLCIQPPRVKRSFARNIHPERKKIIILNSTQWANGTEIKYMFLEGENKQKNVVRQAFRKWENIGIGITFREVKDQEESMVRISFNPKDDSWSSVGRDVLTVSKKKPTMNFAIDLTSDEGMSTALHEVGHTLGFDHEHQSPFAGITWNEKVVYATLGNYPNFWTKADTKAQILDKLPAKKVSGTSWDPDSIMHYEFEAGLVLKPTKYRSGIFPPGLISKSDIIRVKKFYPKVKPSSYRKVSYNKPLKFGADSGQQIDFVFTAPHTKTYTFQTTGKLDTVMVVYEIEGKQRHYMLGDDDSGFDKNSKVTVPLVKGREYLVKIKVTYAPAGAQGELRVS
jgi:hypothetical protein